jgi:hypothetical protein
MINKSYEIYLLNAGAFMQTEGQNRGESGSRKVSVANCKGKDNWNNRLSSVPNLIA